MLSPESWHVIGQKSYSHCKTTEIGKINKKKQHKLNSLLRVGEEAGSNTFDWDIPALITIFVCCIPDPGVIPGVFTTAATGLGLGLRETLNDLNKTNTKIKYQNSLDDANFEDVGVEVALVGWGFEASIRRFAIVTRDSCKLLLIIFLGPIYTSW